jgi:hypothetical protein
MEFAAGKQENCRGTKLLTAITMKITISGDVIPSSLVDSYQYFRETYRFHLYGRRHLFYYTL